MGGKASAPPAPDYTAAAQQTAAGNLENARVTTKANRVNTYTPYGSLTYTQNPNDPDSWSSTINLSPSQQALLDQSNRTSANLSSLQDSATGRVAGQFGQAFDMGALPAQAINPGQTAQDAIFSRLAPQFERKQAALETQLTNQGLMRGSEAWKNAMTDFGQQENDAYTQAALQGINTQNAARQQAIQEQAYLRQLPLNELNALRTGSQVTNPSFTNAPQQNYTPGADYMGAANNGYNAAIQGVNAQNAASGNFMNGLMSLGGTVLSGGSMPWWMAAL